MGAQELRVGKTKGSLAGRRVFAGRYLLGPSFGRGSSAKVVEAIDLSTMDTVVIKRPHIHAPHEAVRQISVEGDVLGQLYHRGCVRLLHRGVENEHPFLVLDRVDGVPLTTRLGAPAPRAMALGWLEGILRALEHVHDAGFVHRDIKPDNVMIRHDVWPEQAPVLVDFGSARASTAPSEEGALTVSGLVSGTPAYMSPEQAMGFELDARSDLYSVGMIAYELLGGRHPFDENDPVALLQQHINADVPGLPSAPRPLDAFVHRLCARLRRDRFASATEALEALHALGAVERGCAAE